jgi:hypothetical protein
MAETKLSAAPVFIYALVFVFVETAYVAFEGVGKRRGYHSSVKADCEDPVLSGTRHVHCRNRCLLLASTKRARLGLLRTAHLPEPGVPDLFHRSVR